ncbi:unnamed protein product [Miscanthus lutarioriparius]|uniref:Protein kinase domain-containing protein n=1 Tax=Miscanthus lutarioriparius TaxID=422564 RepID=A0A811RU28_9POAL|nr:unnamed protein product [Miscanthus lutarioriparius]
MDHQGDNLRDFFQTNGCQVLQRVENNYSLKYFTENEIRNITDGYKSVLGKGGFGEVYKGTLEDQTSVAVKRYIHGTHKEVFAKEVIVHSQINHKNVVRLVGCCTEENSLMIVMEFISNGNLDSILHGNSTNSWVPFPLDKRIKIAIEVAEVLGCMHSMYSPVLHGDIKPANILLDENLTPKISDFGIARLLCANGPQKTTTIIGTIGYIDPAYCESGILTPKSDVYSFGVVLLEIVTRKKVVDATLAQSFNEAITRVEDVQHMFDSATENMKFLGDIGQLAAKCLRRDAITRPEMVEVATSLRMIRKAMQREQDKNTVFPIHDNGPEKYYLDPIDVFGQLFNQKSDVYSFGVVLLELITWKTVRYMYHGRAHVLTTDFLDSYRRDRNAIGIFGKVYDYFDEHEGYFVHEAISIAIDCLQPDIQMRPEMDHVLFRLRIIVARSKLAAGSKLHPTLISTISMEELNEVTKNFNDDVLIGQGPSTKCFLGVLKDGQNFAVKKLDISEEIQVEVPTILRMCYHDNVVQFLGCFLEGKTRVLAYEYAPKGSLMIFFMGIKGVQPGPPLSWLQRVKIAVSAAKGLEFVHEKVDPPIIHSNIKSSKILLFDNDVAKIGDIGVSIHHAPNRAGYLVETVWGPQYCSGWGAQAPKCTITGEYSKKSDVYSFGIVLLELLTGRKVIDNTMPHDQRSLVTWATPRFSEDKVEQCIDPRLGGVYPLKAVSKMAAVAALCVQSEPDCRPEMNIVVRALCPLLNESPSLPR